MDVEALLAPVSDDAPTGEDLSYSPERETIEAPFQLDGSGGDVEDRAWRDSIRTIGEQAKQTKDLWLAVYLMRGGAKVGDLGLVVDGAQMLAGLVERYWEGVHPTLEEADYIGRKTPCESLAKIREFLGPLRRTTIIAHRLGNFSGQDFERFATEGDSAEGYGLFRAAMDDTGTDAFQTAIDQLDALRDALRRTDTIMTERAGDDTGPNLQATYEAIESIRRGIVPYAGLESEPVAEEEAVAGGVVSTGGGGAGPRIAGQVTSRDDVIKAIDAICDYYRQREPSSPVPVLLKRARNWVTLDFIELLDDMVPDALTEARRILVSKSERETSSGW